MLDLLLFYLALRPPHLVKERASRCAGLTFVLSSMAIHHLAKEEAGRCAGLTSVSSSIAITSLGKRESWSLCWTYFCSV